MISAGDFRNGLTVEIEGVVYQVVEFQHVKPGKGAAFVRTKLRNVVDGGVVEKTFRPTEKFPQAHIDKKEMQYLYKDDMYHFMDNESYEQIDLTEEAVGDTMKFVKENDNVKVFSSCCSHYAFLFSFYTFAPRRTEPFFGHVAIVAPPL